MGEFIEKKSMKQLQNDKIIAISATAILYVKTESKFCPNLKKT